jgi:transcriptional regulator with XRE-family HTH domain
MPRAALTAGQRAEGQRLARALQAARMRRKVPQAELAALSGVSVDTIRKLERDGILSPSFFTVARLARELGVKLDTLASDALSEAQDARTGSGTGGSRTRKLG